VHRMSTDEDVLVFILGSLRLTAVGYSAAHGSAVRLTVEPLPPPRQPRAAGAPSPAGAALLLLLFLAVLRQPSPFSTSSRPRKRARTTYFSVRACCPRVVASLGGRGSSEPITLAVGLQGFCGETLLSNSGTRSLCAILYTLSWTVWSHQPPLSLLSI
jgi:hypothetical protein